MDTPDLTHYQLIALKKKQKEANETKYKERSRKRLVNIMTSKMKTCFIGDIAAFEDGFGFLWGHDKNVEDRLEEEQAMFEIWEVVRSKILDNGNGLLRGAINELNHNSISWERYHVDMPVTPVGETDVERKPKA